MTVTNFGGSMSRPLICHEPHESASIMINNDEQSKRNPEGRKAPNPIWAVLVALIIIIGFVIAIFVAVSPALAP